MFEVESLGIVKKFKKNHEIKGQLELLKMKKPWQHVKCFTRVWTKIYKWCKLPSIINFTFFLNFLFHPFRVEKRFNLKHFGSKSSMLLEMQLHNKPNKICNLGTKLQINIFLPVLVSILHAIL
jgi:hypothetical protein